MSFATVEARATRAPRQLLVCGPSSRASTHVLGGTQDSCEHLAYVVHVVEIKAIQDVIALDLGHIGLVTVGQIDSAYAGGFRRQDLLLDATHRQHLAGERDLSGHGDVGVHRAA